MGPEFIQLTGEDGNALEFNKKEETVVLELQQTLLQNNAPNFKNILDKNKNSQDEAIKLNNLLMPLHTSLFIESNPSPVKFAASMLKLSTSEVRLPLVQIEESTKKEVIKALKHAKLLK